MALDQLDQMARLVEGNWAAAWISLAQARATPPTRVDASPAYVRVYTPGVPETLLNMVIRYQSDTPVTAEDVERVIEPYRQWRLPFQWWLTRGAEPEGLRQRLSELGMETWGGATMMLLPLDHLDQAAARYYAPPATVTLDRALTPEDADAALTIICDVFYLPRDPMARWTSLNPAFDLWIARMGPRPVAALVILRDGETAGVYHVATVSGARRRGIAGNLLIQALREARASGSRWATLTATPEARPLYERLGFRACGLLEQWMPGFNLTRSLTGTADYTAGSW